MPTYENGYEELNRFIAQHIHYPDDAREIGIQGRVLVSFIVNTDGSLDSMRVFKLTQGKWESGKQRGVKVKVRMLVPIMMKLSGGQDMLNNPNLSNLNEIMAVKACKKAQYHKALHLYKLVCEAEPDNIYAAHNLGVCLYLTDDINGACEHWRNMKSKGIHTSDYMMTKCTGK